MYYSLGIIPEYKTIPRPELHVSYMQVIVDFILVITHGRFRDFHAELIYLYPPWSYFGSCCSVHLASV